MWEINGCGASTPPVRRSSRERRHLGFHPADVAVGFGHVWVTGQITNKLYKIDPASGHVVQTIPVGREPMGVTVGDGAVWVADAIDGTISKSTLELAHRPPSSSAGVRSMSASATDLFGRSRVRARRPGPLVAPILALITLIGCSAPPPPPAAGLASIGSASSHFVRGPSRRIAT